MATRHQISGIGGLDIADDEHKMLYQQQAAVQSATVIADSGPTDAARAPGTNWDDEEDWQRFFL